MFERYRRWDMQDGRMDARRLSATRHSFKFRIAGRRRKGSQRFSWTAAKDLFRKHLDRRMCMAGTLASARILKLFGQATGTVASTDPHLCRTGFLRRELARSQCRQVKKLRGVLLGFQARLKHSMLQAHKCLLAFAR